ncbi:MAG: hypothetical protein IT368_10855 [Candidatus Hydrogenedentes bacterium]|nr:hypothetical protein [Candidatus Hydrogenedentota bacterium]
MRSVYIVTMWSGGRPAKKWKTYDRPQPLPSGTGVQFMSLDTKLHVEVIGSISVEEFESGKEDMEAGFWENRDLRVPRFNEEGEADQPF